MEEKRNSGIEQKQAEEEIKRFASFPQLNPNPVLEIDYSGKIIFSNDATDKILKEMNLEDPSVFLPGDMKKILADFKENEGKRLDREVRINDRVFIETLQNTPQFNSVRIYAREITERKQAEDALHDSEERLKRSQEIAHLGSWELDLVKNCLTWSDEVYRIFGLQPQEFGATYEAFLEAVHPDDRRAVDAAYSGSLREGRDTYEIVHRIVRKSTGEIRIVHEKCEHFRDESGRLIRSVGMVHDITERKRAEGDLKEAKKLSDYLNSINMVITSTLDFEKIMSGVVVQACNAMGTESSVVVLRENGCWVPKYQYQFPAEVRGIRFADEELPEAALAAKTKRPIIINDTYYDERVNHEAVKRYGVRSILTIPLIIKDEVIGVITFSYHSAPIAFTTAQIDFAIKLSASVSLALENVKLFEEIKQSEEALRRSRDELEIKVQERTAELNKAYTDVEVERQRLYDVLETLPVYVVLLTPDYHVAFANRFFRERFGESHGKRCFEYLFGRSEPCEICETYKVLKTMSPHHWEWTGPDGRNYDIFDYPFTESDGTTLIMEMGIDITERKQAEKALMAYSIQRAVIAELGQTALAGDDLNVLMNKAVALIAQTLGVEYCKVLELLPGGKALLLTAGVGWTEGLVGHATVSAEKESQAGYTLLSEKPVIVEDLQTETRFSGPPLLHDHGVVSGMSVIIPGRERAFGVLGAHTTQLRTFTQDDIHFLQSVANVLAEAIEQNRVDEELQKSESKYRSLIEQAADAIAILDNQLNIIDVNPAACRMSGFRKEELVSLNAKKLLPAEDLIARPLELEKLYAEGKIRDERRIFRKDGSLIEVEVTVGLLEEGGIQVIARDITERKETESKISITNKLLELFAKRESKNEYLESVIQAIHKWSGCRCIGVRVTDKDGYIPYEAYTGFSQEFHKLENMLSLKKDMCACVRALTGEFEPQDASVLTPNGSVVINNSKEFAGRLTKEELVRFRGNCIKTGFLTIALIPIRYRGQTLGLIHLTDEREGMAPLAKVQFLEHISNLIGEAIHRFGIEEALRRSEKSLSEAQYIAHLGNWDWDIQKNKLYWSDEIYRIFGLTPLKFVVDYDAFLNLVHPDDREFLKKAVYEALHEKKPYGIDHRIILPDGAVKIVHEQGHIIFNETGKAVRMVGTVQDVTENKQAEEKLKESLDRLRDLSAHLQSIREEERTNVAREIHDELGQALTAVKMDISWLSSKLPGNKPSLLKKARSSLNLIDTTIQSVKRICTELRPGLLDHLGLGPAIEWQVEEFGNRTGIKCATSIEDGGVILHRDISTAIFRIVQEALTNVARHARATEVEISLEKQDGLLVMQVRDNGRGITEKQVSKAKSYGLLGIKERVHHFGGEVEIRGVRNKGTMITVSIPIKKEEGGK